MKCNPNITSCCFVLLLLAFGRLSSNVASNGENLSEQRTVTEIAEDLLSTADTPDAAAKLLKENKYDVSHFSSMHEKATIVLGTLSTSTVNEHLVMQWSICAVYSGGNRQVFGKREHFVSETKDGKVTLRRLRNWP